MIKPRQQVEEALEEVLGQGIGYVNLHPIKLTPKVYRRRHAGDVLD